MGKVVIAGGTGFIGQALAARLTGSGHEVSVLARQGRSVPHGRPVSWDGGSSGPWTDELDGATAVVNLCGAPIMKRWTSSYKETMRASRIGTTRLIGEAVATCANPPKLWLNGSATGFYGDTGDWEVSEASPAGSGFLADLCVEWEAAVRNADTPATKKCTVRTGVTLGNGGGPLALLTKVVKAYLGGALAPGTQYISWIHIEDLTAMMEWAIDSGFEGTLNGTAPMPVTNSAMMGALREAYARPPVPTLPAPVVALLCDMQGWPHDLLAGGQRAVPEIALARGYKFSYPTIQEALLDLARDVPEAWITKPRAAETLPGH